MVSRKEMHCHFCGTHIVPQQGGASLTIGVGAMRERVKHTGHRCSACNLITCCPCSRKAADKVGANYFVCPKCEADIRDDEV